MQGLRQNVSDHVIGGHILHSDLAGIKSVLHEEETDVNMTRALLVGSPVLDQLDRRHIILVEISRAHVVSLIDQKLSDKHK